MRTQLPLSWADRLLRALRRRSRGSPIRVRPEVLDRVASVLREGNIAQAEELLKECGKIAEADPDCLNLLGIAAEARGKWKQARRFWVKAVRSDDQCQAARQNLRRYYELFQWGRCRDSVAFGDRGEMSFQDSVPLNFHE